jgi:glycosyltransferase involved in cell wall biosynthesis
MKLPTISIVIPTLNSEKLLPECLKSIKMQDYPRENIEILVIDGGSVDKTVEIAKMFSVDRIIPNPKKTAEAAYAISMMECKNDIIAYIDSDNILPSRDWFKKMVKPFEDKEIVGTEPLYYTYRKKDNLITRYCALIGMNDPLCMYLGNYDRFCVITGKWTEAPVKVEEKAVFLKIKLLDEGNLPTIGANGFLVRRKELIKSYPVKDYWVDIDAIYSLVKAGYNNFAKVRIGIVHLFANDIKTFIKKQRRRIKDYLFYEEKGMRLYPWKKNRRKIMKFIFLTVLVLPLLFDALKGYRRIKDKALFFHIPACWVTLIVYGLGVLEGLFKKEIASREVWH